MIPVTPDYLSLTTYHLEIGYSHTKTIFSHATGFIYIHEGVNYLITNWHNVTGRNPLEKKRLSEHAGIPNYIKTFIRWDNNTLGGSFAEINLYEDNEMNIPKWLIHPNFKEKVDVVAIRLNINDKVNFRPINKNAFDNDIPPEVGDECFVIGYPFENKRDLEIPIWKKASIASEPFIDIDNLPKTLIDTATRPGLSGSPVIYQRSGIHKVFNGKIDKNTLLGRIRGFLGVYSGRIGKDDDFSAQLGIVWKAKVIDQIIEGNLRGDTDFQNW